MPLELRILSHQMKTKVGWSWLRTRNFTRSTSHFKRVHNSKHNESVSFPADSWKYPEWTTGAAIYVHWPYCEKRCSYCNFNKYISHEVDHRRMANCLVQETEYLLDLSQVSEVSSIFFGGGTPSLAEPSTFESIIQAVSRRGLLSPDVEITMEANPSSSEATKLGDFKQAGINRVSVGIQTLNERELQILGRNHTVAESLRCLEIARHLFPGKTSVDLIFGRPGQVLVDWRTELQQMLRVCDDHLSLYQLTLERGTALYKQVTRGELVLPGDSEMADMYESAVQILERNGFVRYEVSNFARNGAESCHNKTYWQGGQYIGVGPGAHGRFMPKLEGGKERQARIQTLEPEPWMWEVERYGHGTRKITAQTTLNILEEVLLVGLRTRNGIPEKRWEHYGSLESLNELFGSDEHVIWLQEQGFLTITKSGLKATAKGINVIDSILPHLLDLLYEKNPMVVAPENYSGNEGQALNK